MEQRLVALFAGLLLWGQAGYAQIQPVLWYEAPARNWNEALPIGNGRLGGMVYGGIAKEVIQLNEESLVAGHHADNNNPLAAAHIDEIRALLFAGRNGEAHELAKKTMLATPPNFRSYQTLGKLEMQFVHEGAISEYRRSLDIDRAVSTVSYRVDDQLFTREYFASAPDNSMVIRLKSEQPQGLNFKINLYRELDASVQVLDAHTLLMTGQVVDVPSLDAGEGGLRMKFNALVRVIPTNGKVEAANNAVLVSGSDEVLLLVTAATDYNLLQLSYDRSIDPRQRCEAIIQQASQHGFASLLDRHLAEYQPVYRRVALDLGGADHAGIPTDKRLARVKEGAEDKQLAALYFQYGRYLLLSSSRAPGVLPANLQGIWNEFYDAPWQSDYHTNINLQMNYWHADVANLSETVRPYVDFVDQLRVPGRAAAANMYGADGWTIHHATDVFGKTGIISGIHWGTSPLSGAWLCLNLWENYQFTGDVDYLRERLYPIMRESAVFVQDFLVPGPDGYLATAPSMSPENTFILPDGKRDQLTYSPAIDIQLVMALFEACIEAGELLGEDRAFIRSLESTLAKLPPIRVSERYGIVQEWIEDYEEAEPGHRHMSQLLGLYPATLITPDTPELFEAAKKTLERRLAHGGGHTGWSRAWMINFYARLLDGEKAWENVQDLLAKSTLNNLLDTHPPFQIDGNFGGTAGIAEMLLQSHNGHIELLPAIPAAWPDGSYSGLVARGGFEVDVDWKAGKLAQVRILSRQGGACTVKYGGQQVKLQTKKGETYLLNDTLKQYTP